MSHSAPEISVIIPCRRVVPTITHQLDALASQDGAPPFEVILVDNGGNDGLHHVVAAFAERLECRIVCAPGRRGTSHARNVGIQHSRSNKLLFCDADDVVMGHWMAAGSSALDRHPIFTGAAIECPPELFSEDLATIREYIAAHPQQESRRAFTQGEYPILLGCSCGMRRDFAERIGGFDEAFGSQGEDNDLAFRAIKATGSLPVESSMMIAYRLRRDDEQTFRRGLAAGVKHALVCARHDAWRISPAYRGHWVLRPLLDMAHSLRHHRYDRDAQGRQVGVIIGRMRYLSAARAPRTHFLSTINEQTDGRQLD